jgi:hypothetical protein
MQTCEPPSLDSIFVSWNKATLESLDRQIKATTDSLRKTFYNNRFLSTKEYWGIKNIYDLNTNSIRYKFLKALFVNLNDKTKDFYVIEANESGSKVLLRNFIVYKSSTNKALVEFYDFFNDDWQKKGKFKEDNFTLQTDLKNYLSQFGKGFNYDDIVITEFKNGYVQESEYYLYSTLSADSQIKKILDGCRKENFIK